MEKLYEHVTSGEQVKIFSDEGTFYVLDNKTRIKKESFDAFYKEALDPEAFLNSGSALDSALDQLKTMDTSKLVDADTTANIKYTPATVLADSSTGFVADATQSPAEPMVITDDLKQEMIEEYNRKNPTQEITQPQHDEDVRLNETIQPQTQQPQPQSQPQVDPIDMMFKMFKNNYDVKINIEFEEKIANPEFVKLVMENVEGDPIEYYTKKILGKLMKDPLKLKKEIYKQVKKAISGEDEEIDTVE